MKVFRLLGVLLVTLSIAGFVESSYHQLKGELAQLLLTNAWNDSLRTGENTRPWNWADTWPELKLSFKKTSQAANSISPDLAKGASSLPELIVLADASGESLAFGPGLLTPGILPGEIGNSLIAAHRDTHFARLAELNINDELYIELKNRQNLRFIIDQIIIIDSEQEAPVVEQTAPRVTLITCYPFNMKISETSLRYLVSGYLKPAPVS